MSGEIIGLKGVKIPDLQETTEVRDSNYMILVDEETGRTYKVKREHIKAQKTSELVDDVGFLRAIPGEYMTESEVKEFTDAEIAQIFLNVDGINLECPLYIKEGLSRNEPNTSEYSRIVRAATDITKGSFKIQLGTGGGGFEVVNSGWDNCLLSVNEEDGVQISSIDGGSRLKINGSTILPYGSIATLGDFNNRWGDVYIGNQIHDTNGFTKLTNGLIVQWGKFTVNCGYRDSIKTDVTLPITFPNRVFFQSAICTWNMSLHNYDWTSAILNSAISIGTNMLRIETRGIVSEMPKNVYEINYFIVGF